MPQKKNYFSSRKNFRELLDKFLALITLSNGRRGGEPPRMTIEQAIGGLNSKWIGNLEQFNRKERKLIQSQTIIFVYAKGEKEVDVIFDKVHDKLLGSFINSDLRCRGT